jgi:DNA-directed RNA polymerase beta' subunit
LDEINNIYIRILKSVKILTTKADLLPIVVNSTLGMIQAEYFTLNEYALDYIRSKEGLIRNQICGVRLNYTARSIISPAFAGRKIDEIVVPYKTFLELYKFEIINVIKNVKKVSYKEAETIHFNAGLKFDEEVYLIMKDLIDHNEVGVLLNRNPTINIGSILYLRITDIKHNIDDLTMSVNNCILTLLAGDYDGDTLNLISIKDSETRDLFKSIFSPIHLMIDPKNGKFNNDLNLERDQVLGLNALLS